MCAKDKTLHRMATNSDDQSNAFSQIWLNGHNEKLSIKMGSNTENPSNVAIRSFQIEDFDDLMALWDETRLPYKPEGRDRRDKIEREIQKPNAIFLVAERDGELIGSVFATHDGRKGWINRLAVSPAFRRCGIAKRLVAEAESRLCGQGIEIVACLIENWNVDSARFFEKLGYWPFEGVTYYTKRKDSNV